jgi:small subunit ribosomal protein S17
MATTKKTDSGKPAPKQSAARKPAAKKAAAKKSATTRKPSAKKAAEAAAVKPVKKVSAAKAKAKADRAAPERVPGRKERRGVVVSDAMDKTVRRSSKLHAHDEHNAAGIGDLVRVVESRPLSATKRWRLLEILEKAK